MSSSTTPRRALLRYSADKRTLAFITLYFTLTALAWVFLPSSPIAIAAVVLVLATSSWQCAVITHNTVHCPMFHSRRLNRLMQVVLTQTYGHPVSTFVPGHNLSHHKFVETEKDVMRTTKMRSNWNIINVLLFFPTVVPAILKNDAIFAKGMKSKKPEWHKQLMLEAAVLALISVALLVADPFKFLAVWLVPHMIASWGIITVNYLQHDGCDMNHRANHSRNFTGRFFNWWTVNNGYHGMHHVEPNMHWSLLPEAHREQIAPHLHPNLSQPSFYGFVFKMLFLQPRRVRYDGTPYAPPAKIKDVSWVPRMDRPVPDISLGAET